MRRASARRCLLVAAAAVGLSCGGEGGGGGPTSPEPTPATPQPTPTAVSVAPFQALAGAAPVTLTVTGADFVRASTVRWNGADRPTTFVSASRLTASVVAADLATAGPAAVTVATPAPGGGVSAALAFTVRNVTPALTGIAPTSARVGDAALTIEVTGSGFTSASEVRWNGFARPTTFVSSTRLTAAIPASDLALAAVRSVTVSSPYADVSAPVSFTVLTPPPVLTAIAPTGANALAPAFTLTVTGSAFTPGSVVRANGVERPTTYVSPTELRSTILPGDLPTPGTPVQITVLTRAPGGGVSAAVPLAVLNPTPILTSIEPPSAAAGAPGATVVVTGDRFVPGAAVRWNGAERPTTFQSATRLSVALPAGDLAARATAEVTVANPAPGGGVSSSRTFVVVTSNVSLTSQLVIDLPTRDIVADPVRSRLYVSVPASDPTRGNTVTAIDPLSGAILFSVPVGTDPSTLAIADDGSFLYVALDGDYAVRRVDLATATADLRFPLGDSYWGPMRAGDMAVLRGAPRSLAVARLRPQVIPSHGGVAIYDDGVMRPTVTQEHTGSDEIELGEGATTLYGFNRESTEFGLRQLAISSAGVTEVRVRSGVIDGYPYPTTIVAGGGRIFSSHGAVVDAATLSRVGTLPDTGLVRPDAPGGQVLVLDGTRLAAYHITELIPLGALTVPMAGDGRLVRWGSDGVAYRSGGARVVVLRTNLVGP